MSVLQSIKAYSAIALLAMGSLAVAQVEPKMNGDLTQGYLTTVDGVRLHFARRGTGDDVLVVPNEVYMIDDFGVLAENRTVIFYDLRNRGRSDAVSDPEKLKGGVQQDVEDLDSVRRHFGLRRFSLLAHSYPSVIAALYAIRHPTNVERVIQIGPPPADASTPIAPEYRYSDAVGIDVFTKLQALATGNPQLEAAELCRRSWELLRPLYVGHPQNATRLSHWGFCDLPNERGAMTHFQRYVLPSLQSLRINTSEYADAAMPFLIIHGTHDRNAPYGAGREWARRLPNARFITVQGAAHVPYIEDRERVLPAIEMFLSGQWPADAQAVR